MSAATRNIPFVSPLVHHGVQCGTSLIAILALAGAAVGGQVPVVEKAGAGEEAVDGLFITVRNPLDSVGFKRIKAQTDRFIDRPDRRGLKIVYDFNPDGYPSQTSDYGVCRDLAEYLLHLQDVTTIAFVHNDVTGHTVLPVLACKEIVMSKNAKLGDVPG